MSFILKFEFDFSVIFNLIFLSAQNYKIIHTKSLHFHYFELFINTSYFYILSLTYQCQV